MSWIWILRPEYSRPYGTTGPIFPLSVLGFASIGNLNDKYRRMLIKKWLYLDRKYVHDRIIFTHHHTAHDAAGYGNISFFDS